MSRALEKLKKENALLKKRIEGPRELHNSLASLAAGASAFTQDNLTSFLPLITANVYAPLTINYNVLMYMYKTHGVIQTAIDQPVEDAFRGGLELLSDESDAADLGELEDFMEDIGALEKVKSTLGWGRLFGGGALITNVESDPSKPLDFKKLRKGSKLAFYDATRWELGAEWRYSDKYSFYGQTLDPSRVLTVGNKRAPWIIRQQLSGWDMSEIERIIEDFNLFLRTRNVLYEILSEAKVDVYMLDGLAEQLATSAGTEKTMLRIQTMNQLKNFQNALVLDKNDLYETKQLTFSGLAEVMKENRMGLASALRMPISKIFGVGASGFSSGEDDIENYNSMVESNIRQPARPLVRKVINICQMALWGKEYDINFRYHPLRIMSSKDEEEINRSKQSRIETWYDRGLVESQEAAQWAQKEKLLPIETKAERGELDPHPMPPGLDMGGEDDGEQGDEKDERSKDA